MVRKNKLVNLEGERGNGLITDLFNFVKAISSWPSVSPRACLSCYNTLAQKIVECSADWVAAIQPRVLEIMGVCYYQYTRANPDSITHDEAKRRIETLEHHEPSGTPTPVPSVTKDRSDSTDLLGFDSFLFSPPATTTSTVAPPTILPSALLSPNLLTTALPIPTFPLPLSPSPSPSHITSYPRLLTPHLAAPLYTPAVLHYLKTLEHFPHKALTVPLLQNHLNVRVDQITHAIIATGSTPAILALLRLDVSGVIGAVVAGSIEGVKRDVLWVDIVCKLLGGGLKHFEHQNLRDRAMAYLRTLSHASFIASLHVFVAVCPRVFHEKAFDECVVAVLRKCLSDREVPMRALTKALSEYFEVAVITEEHGRLVDGLIRDYEEYSDGERGVVVGCVVWVYSEAALREFNLRVGVHSKPAAGSEGWDWCMGRFGKLDAEGQEYVCEQIYKRARKAAVCEEYLGVMLTFLYTVYRARKEASKVVEGLGRAMDIGGGRARALEVVYALFEDGKGDDLVSLFEYLGAKGGFQFLTGVRRGLLFDGGVVVGSGRSLVARIVMGSRSGSEEVRIAAIRCGGAVGALLDRRSSEVKGLIMMMEDRENGGWRERMEKSEAHAKLSA